MSLGSSRKVAGGWAGSGDLPWRVAFPGRLGPGHKGLMGEEGCGLGGGAGVAYMLT